jgi:carbamate kinase
MATAIPRRLVVAVGGNATHPEEIRGTADEQKIVAARTARSLLPLALLDDELVITHGNGPVVEADNARHVACLLTQVEVDPGDPAFADPTKPIGPFFAQEQAEKLSRELGWLMKEDAGRGWRHVVPSPQPRHIVDISLIQVLARRGTIVIAGGGGGIPVVRGHKGIRTGIAAVIDKDLTSAHMANVLGIDHLLMLTATPKVAVDFGKPTQRWLDRVTLREIKAFRAEGHFPAGSMGPKIDAAIRFLEGVGERAIIAHLEEAMPALRGETGTHIVTDDV